MNVEKRTRMHKECILYASPCAPLLVLWPGEVEGTSLAMAQGRACCCSPVPRPAPMFRVSAVLRRYDADVPPTAVEACYRRRLGIPVAGFYAVLSGAGGRTQHHPLECGGQRKKPRKKPKLGSPDDVFVMRT